jgi:hypothetical protein
MVVCICTLESRITLNSGDLQCAQVLAGVAMPDAPEEWQNVMLKGVGADGNGCSVSLTRSDPMFDWRLVAAIRVLCAESERDFEGMNMEQLGDLDAPLSDKLEVPQQPHRPGSHAFACEDTRSIMFGSVLQLRICAIVNSLSGEDFLEAY